VTRRACVRRLRRPPEGGLEWWPWVHFERRGDRPHANLLGSRKYSECVWWNGANSENPERNDACRTADRVQMLQSPAGVIQLALTPVFLLTAVAALLNVFSTRLGRVADRVDLLSADLERGAADTEFLSAQLDFLRKRSLILDVAVVLATVGGAATCAAALVLFFGALRDAEFRALLFGLFGGAIVFTITALVTFAIEMIMAGRGLRVVVRHHQKTADQSSNDRIA